MSNDSRLSIHLTGIGGWRCGKKTLNYDSAWRKVIFLLDKVGKKKAKVMHVRPQLVAKKKVYQPANIENLLSSGIKYDFPYEPYKNSPRVLEVYNKPYGQRMTDRDLIEAKSRAVPRSKMCFGAISPRNQDNVFMMACADSSFLHPMTKSKQNSGTLHNGAYWYWFSNYSFGFSDNNDICLGSCDYKRHKDHSKLCWHLTGGGWRAGSNLWLSSDTKWRKIIWIVK